MRPSRKVIGRETLHNDRLWYKKAQIRLKAGYTRREGVCVKVNAEEGHSRSVKYVNRSIVLPLAEGAHI